MLMKCLELGDKCAKYPVIQGGMGVGVSLSQLAGAVAHAGGVGVISSAQIGFDEPDFKTNTREANIRALTRHIKNALAMKREGLVGVNVMVALKDYREHVRTAAQAGADIIISGAGLPVDLPELVAGTGTKIAPIVSSVKAVKVILSMWERKYKRTADMVVIEGPEAGGHLGFSREDIESGIRERFDDEIRGIIECVKGYAERFGIHIPVIAAGGIFNGDDVRHALSLGADGVQAATRFVATKECDASDAYKQAYIDASADDITIIKSPVGMPGRALNNSFIRRIKDNPERITECFGCLAHCNPSQVPYCITKALINAVRGDIENGLIFCGSNVSRIDCIITVDELMGELIV